VSAIAELPKFETLDELVAFWDIHDFTVQPEVENEQDHLWICHCERSEAIPKVQLPSTVEIASSLRSSQ